jgi:hypothetical protein
MANLLSVSTAEDGRGNALVIKTDGRVIALTKEDLITRNLDTPSKIKDTVEFRLSKALDMEFRVHINRDGTLQVIYGDLPVGETAATWTEDLAREDR